MEKEKEKRGKTGNNMYKSSSTKCSSHHQADKHNYITNIYNIQYVLIDIIIKQRKKG